MASRRTVGFNESVPLTDGTYERTWRWGGGVFRASRRDTQLCSARCRSGASRHDALQANAAARAAKSRCTACGGALGDAHHGAHFCSDLCRQRVSRLQRSEKDPLKVTATMRGVRVCAGPSCSIVFAIASHSGHPRVYCSTRCRVARHRADAVTREATS